MANEGRIILGSYDTLTNLWEIASCTFPVPDYKSAFVPVPGRSGDLDFSTVLTDGEPVYNNRTLTVTLESTSGTRLERKARINSMINALDGMQMQIVLPDEEDCYVYGRVHVAEDYNEPAISAVSVTANCEPWRYSNDLTTQTITATETATDYTLTNTGRRTAVPTFVVSDSVTIVFGTYTITKSAGTYILPDITVPTGGATITVSGSGTLTASYREANL